MAERLGGLTARTGFLYLRKWTVVSIATGIVAGLGVLALNSGNRCLHETVPGHDSGIYPAATWRRDTSALDTYSHRATLANTRLHHSRRVGQWPNSC